MTTDVLERPETAADEEERVFVTLTVADQLCGVPVLGVRDILGEHKITRIPLAPPEIAGSLQYAGVHLKTPLFVVLGHEGCGAVGAALETRRAAAVSPPDSELSPFPPVYQHSC